MRAWAGDDWQDNDLVFATRYGTLLGAGNVRRSFKAIGRKAKLDESVTQSVT